MFIEKVHFSQEQLINPLLPIKKMKRKEFLQTMCDKLFNKSYDAEKC